MKKPIISSLMDRVRAFVARDPGYARTYCRRLYFRHLTLHRARQDYGDQLVAAFRADRTVGESWGRMIQETDREASAAFLEFDRLESAIADHARTLSPQTNQKTKSTK